MSNATCIEPGCSVVDTVARGLCRPHYNFHQYRGDLDEVAPRRYAKSCRRCGQPFEATAAWAIYCSIPCKRFKKKPPRNTVCAWCGNPLRPEQRSNAQYCSRTCSSRGVADAKANAKRPVPFPCRVCESPIPRAQLKYCSKPCRRIAEKARQYGLTARELRQLIDGHPVCAICGTEDWGAGACIDHDHATGRVRGIICHDCNTGLGFFKDDLTRLRAAIAYLEAHAMT